VFNPVPGDQMQSICTDRPTKSNLPCTVDAGHFQYEADIFNWTRSTVGGSVTSTYLFTNPTAKLGLTDKIDVELNMVPYEEITTHNSEVTGVGDLFARMKYNLFGNGGGDVAATLLPYVKVPTAKAGIGNRSFEGGLISPVSFALPMDFSLLFDPELDVLRNSTSSGYHAQFQGLANVSRTVIENVTGYVELWSSYNNDPKSATTQVSLDVAVSWLIKSDLQLDVGANFGLNKFTARTQAYFGISQRF
jgi:hypothetical protein